MVEKDVKTSGGKKSVTGGYSLPQLIGGFRFWGVLEGERWCLSTIVGGNVDETSIVFYFLGVRTGRRGLRRERERVLSCEREEPFVTETDGEIR